MERRTEGDFEARIKRDVVMAPYTWWSVGGVADAVFEPRDVEELKAFLSAGSARMPLTWLGLGSNVLIRDGGIRGTVILLSRSMKTFEILDGDRIYAEAGLAAAKLAREAARAHLVGLDFMCGIPGTVGGALAMNAGAFGGSTWDYVESVSVIDVNGQQLTRPASEFEADYRSLGGLAENEWFVGATFALQRDESFDGEARIRELLRQRSASQPTGQRSCGSVFKNPPGDYAGRLVEAAGLKGLQHGGAVVSAKHGNFIINDGNASASDIESLIEAVQRAVHEQFGIDLEAEVRVIGDRVRSRP